MFKICVVVVLTLSLPAAAAAQSSPANDIGAAFVDSLKLLMVEHGTRIAFQEKTRRELGGPFFADYARSIRWPQQWEDGDAWFVNYIGHPIHGTAAALIWLDHTTHRDERLSLSGSYWASRGKAAAYTAVYSFQFEFGPLSEASIGNVGLHRDSTGWVDHVVTPVGGLALLIAEDALDRYLVEWIERRVGNRVVRASVRMLFNPSRTLANVAQTRAPWSRANRPLTTFAVNRPQRRDLRQHTVLSRG
jgi:hypothetical protein